MNNGGKNDTDDDKKDGHSDDDYDWRWKAMIVTKWLSLRPK